MSNIDQLIQQYCPNGVEFKTLGDIAYYANPSFSLCFSLGKKSYVGQAPAGQILYVSRGGKAFVVPFGLWKSCLKNFYIRIFYLTISKEIR